MFLSGARRSPKCLSYFRYLFKQLRNPSSLCWSISESCVQYNTCSEACIMLPRMLGCSTASRRDVTDLLHVLAGLWCCRFCHVVSPASHTSSALQPHGSLITIPRLHFHDWGNTSASSAGCTRSGEGFFSGSNMRIQRYVFIKARSGDALNSQTGHVDLR